MYQEKRVRIYLLEQSFGMRCSNYNGGNDVEKGHSGEHMDLIQQEEEFNTNNITEDPIYSSKIMRDNVTKKYIQLLGPFLNSIHTHGQLLIRITITHSYSDLTPFSKKIH